ncbi:DUF5590 domain-containing protein [Halobacillus mangrovi]|uniref:cell wall elongation regulator TseB-like domain-containing protein n=1 Tax=Halobacillus mangrovi TaxID=402384 RepID=UPI003D960C1B
MRTIKPQSSQFTVPRWVKWTSLTFAVLVIIFLLFFSWMYFEINKDRTAGQEDASKIALEETKLSEVDQVTVYRGEQTVHIVEGKSNQGDHGLIYIDLKEKKVIEQLFNEKVISKEALKQKWSQSCGGCEFKYIQYAFEENQPVYEMSYIDEKNRYVLDYFKLSGESFDQRFAFRQN